MLSATLHAATRVHTWGERCTRHWPIIQLCYSCIASARLALLTIESCVMRASVETDRDMSETLYVDISKCT